MKQEASPHKVMKRLPQKLKIPVRFSATPGPEQVNKSTVVESKARQSTGERTWRAEIQVPKSGAVHNHDGNLDPIHVLCRYLHGHHPEDACQSSQEKHAPCAFEGRCASTGTATQILTQSSPRSMMPHLHLTRRQEARRRRRHPRNPRQCNC